jgi:hypothetical protein
MYLRVRWRGFISLSISRARALSLSLSLSLSIIERELFKEFKEF